MGEPLDVLGSLDVSFCMSVVQVQQRFMVARDITHPLILGWDFFVANNVVLDVPNSKLQVHGMSVPMLNRNDLTPITSKVVIATNIQIPANSEKNILMKVSDDRGMISSDYTGIFEPESESDLLFARTLSITSNGCFPVLVMNSTPNDISLYEDTPVGQFYSAIGQTGEYFEVLDDTPNSINLAQERNETSISHIDLSDSDLTCDQERQVRGLLSEYSDIFSKHPTDYGRTNLLYHSIDTGEFLPPKQRAYRMSPKLRTVMQK